MLKPVIMMKTGWYPLGDSGRKPPTADLAASGARRGFEDAYAAQKEASPEPTAAGRKRKLTAKGKGRAQDPAMARAEHILATGGEIGIAPDDMDI